MNTIYLIGDSTCHTNSKETYPQHGWGQVFSMFINDKYNVINLAENGRSSKSFYDEGLFNKCEQNIKENDFLFIQFGHNDEKDDEKRHTDPFTTYQQYLRYYVNVAKSKKAIPVLLSSIYRRHFDEFENIKENCHLNYPDAMKDLANKEDVIYIDMCELTKQMLINLGKEKSKELFMNFDKGIYHNYPDGKEDNTHLRYKGALEVCKILVNQINKIEKLKVILK